MVLKGIFWGFVAALLLTLVWRYRNAEAIHDWIHSQDKRPAAIEFDNGTVRQMEAASQPGARTAVVGGVRKCRKGTTVVYTDGDCPKGAQEQTLRNGTVTVVPVQGETAWRP